MRNAIVWTGAFLVFVVTFGLHRETGLFVGCALNLVLGAFLVPRKMWAWIPALAISWTWIGLGRSMYTGYNVFQASLGGINLFPILAWPNLLVLIYFWIYPVVRAGTWWGKWLRLSAIYSVLLILTEYLGYNLAGVHLAAGSGYPGWPLLNIFHCPWWMQLSYFLNGILFCGVTAWITERRFLTEAGGRRIMST